MSASGDDDRPLTALGGVELLISGADYATILDHLLTANTGVEPEHLGIAFHNAATGERLDRQEVRELMGPVRQDGAYEFLSLATEFTGGALPYTQAQLELLMDAAFVASMRQPPDHISVEYYDTRTGPVGVGGGVSGRVPERSEGTRSNESARVSPESYRPATEAEVIAHFERLNVRVPQRPGYVVLPLMAGAADDDALDAALARQIARAEAAFDVRFEERIAKLIDVSPEGVPRVSMVGYYTAEEDVLRALEEEIDGMFYEANAEPDVR
ncbi:hypothetical protein [Aquisalimonas asiatica]|uniref:hypothetical protein n=1 Tax=Aquisalimonas asiatica TaxID=406100 RepID=UPI001113D0DE|nr:hypothetical protein [Aquisalimonas asiatica]